MRKKHLDSKLLVIGGIGLILTITIIYYMSNTGNGGGFLSIIGDPMSYGSDACRDTDNGDPYTPGQIQVHNIKSGVWEPWYSDVCYGPNTTLEYSCATGSATGHVFANQDKFNCPYGCAVYHDVYSGPGFSIIRNMAYCRSEPDVDYVPSTTSTIATTTTTQATTTTPPTLPTQSTTTTFYSGGGGGSEPNWLMDLWNSVLGWLWRWN